MPKTFIWDNLQEPHFERRKKIMKEFPEVKKLFGIDRWLKLKVLLVTTLQLVIPIFFLPENPWLFILLGLTVGATLTHILFLAIHELSHDLAFKKKSLNNWLAMIANIPLVFPFAMAFKVYHLEHHWHQGVDKVDTDIPSETEALIFKGFFGKLIWMINQILFYSIRPLLVRPIRPTSWMIVNFFFQVSLISGFFYLAGWYGIGYLLLSIFVSGGLHPIGGHFIAEHFVFVDGQETYSYYGPWNRLAFNVGFHNEHHDFPNIPGSRLPEVRKIASPFYDPLHSYNSWSMVMIRFISQGTVSLFSRVKRKKRIDGRS